MKNKLKSPVGLNPGGIGPKIFKSTMPFLIAGILLGIFFPSTFTFPFSIRFVLKILGWIMLGIGILAYLLTMVHFLKNFSKGILITDGIFRLSRNPLYSSWILFILPGISFVTDNWTILISAIALYVFFVINIKEEEESLSAIFGDEYTQYCNKVGRIFFFI
jgi:protein-S-isoprenylcysteine O-methyltransferase Ste14